MALLSTITILESFPSGHYAKGELLNVYHASGEITVTITGTSGTFDLIESSSTDLPLPSTIIKPPTGIKSEVTGNEPSTVVFWSRVQTGHSFRVITREPTLTAEGIIVTHTFTTVRSFPYMNELTTSSSIPRLEEPPPVDDMELSLTSTTFATTNSSNDGTLVVTATGSNSPFQYYDNDPAIGTIANGSGTFTNLAAGNYTLYSKDSANFIATLDVELQFTGVPILNPNEVLIGDYKVRWRHQQLTIDGDTYRTDIYQRDYDGDIDDVLGGVTPFSVSRRSESDDFINMNILSSEATINFIAESDNQFIDIILGDDQKFMIIRSRKNPSSLLYEIKWQGFVTPQSYRDILFMTPYEVSISGNDRTGDMKAFKFLLGDNNSNNRITTSLSQLNILHICLSKTLFSFSYRIACNIFAEEHIQLNKTPLDQTFVNCKKYIENDEVMNCEEVLLDIIKTYSAVLFAWDGYWYFVRKEEWLNTKIDYVEYDTSLAFVSTGSWNTRVIFKSCSEGERAVWKGAQARIYTPTYSNINVQIETGLVKEQSIVDDFDQNDITFIGGIFNGFGRWNLFSINDDLFINRPTADNSILGLHNSWEIAIGASGNSSTYLEYTGILSYTGGDEINIKSSFLVKALYERNAGFADSAIDIYPSYLQLKWSLRLDDQWVNNSNEWSTEEKLNYYFFQRTEKEEEFEKNITLPVDGSTGADYQFRLYVVDVSESDFHVSYNSNAGNGDALQDAINRIGSNSFPIIGARKAGDRLISGVGNDFYYYELVPANSRPIGLEPDKIACYGYHPTANGFAWLLINTVNLPFTSSLDGLGSWEYCIDGSCGNITSKMVTHTLFSSIFLELVPVGNPPLEEITIQGSTNPSNNVDLDYPIRSFDLGTLNSSLFTNYLQLEDGSPTKNWTVVGKTITQSIERYILDFIIRFTKNPKAKVSGEFRTDGVEVTPLNVFEDVSDGSKLYISTGLSSDDKSQEFNGQMIEIASGDEVSPSGFTKGFKQTAMR